MNRVLKHRLKLWWREHIRSRLFPPKFYVATYGDMGLEVVFFRNEDAYDEAVAEAEGNHRNDRIDTYTCGEMVHEHY